jgi:AbrB family looped-hinge helix DNA binding protein
MYAATLTEKFQVSIPKAFRENLSLKAGQQFVFIAKGDAIVMVPRRDINEVRGLFKGANTENTRDRAERF